jgi:hypothetical protein
VLAVDTAATAYKKRGRYLATLLSVVVIAGGSGCSVVRPAAGETTPVSKDGPLTSPSQPTKTAKGKPAGDSGPKTGSTPEAVTETESAEKPEAVKKPKPKPEQPTDPAIVFFRVKQKPTCESGTDAVRYPGEPVELEWKVKGADKVTLAVDGPGIYGEYGASGHLRLDFPCAGPANTYVSHRYTLAVTHGKFTKHRTIHVKARVNELATL